MTAAGDSLWESPALIWREALRSQKLQFLPEVLYPQEAGAVSPSEKACQTDTITLHRFLPQAMPYLMTVSIPSILSLASYPKSSICARASRHPFSSLASLMDFSSAFSALRLLLEYLTSCHEEHAPQAVRIAVQIPIGRFLVYPLRDALFIYQQLQLPPGARLRRLYETADDVVPVIIANWRQPLLFSDLL